MTLWQEFDSRARRFGIVDLKLAQAAAFFLALILVEVVPVLASVSVWWYVALCLACAVKPAIDFFSPRPAASPRVSRSG
ncbi:MAG: hypothetical protein ACYSUF_07430 [Planctomycetota bacterium]|jgi:hypothetical protein